jgi:hypothetical protein
MSAISPLPAIRRSSANVRLTLYIGATSYRIAQIGEDFFILSQETLIPGTNGIVCIQIDDYEKRQVVTWAPSEAPRRIVKVTFSPLP